MISPRGRVPQAFEVNHAGHFTCQQHGLDNLEVGAHDPLTALTVRPVGSAPFSGAITLVSRAAARASFPNAKPGRGFLRLGKKGKRAMAEQVNLRIARQGWDAWNAHDVEGWLKSSTKSTCGRPIRCRRLS